MINADLLNRIDLADVACTRAHYSLLTDSEAAERNYRSRDIGGAWVYVETRNGQRVGHISMMPGLPGSFTTAHVPHVCRKAKCHEQEWDAASGNYHDL